MRLLLDTHIFLWYITGDARVGTELRTTIENADAVYLSVTSVWEATIKYNLGKLPLPHPPHPWLTAQRELHGIESLAIDEASVARLSDLESHHRDPFDRILVCQAIEHDFEDRYRGRDSGEVSGESAAQRYVWPLAPRVRWMRADVNEGPEVVDH